MSCFSTNEAFRNKCLPSVIFCRNISENVIVYHTIIILFVLFFIIIRWNGLVWFEESTFPTVFDGSLPEPFWNKFWITSIEFVTAILYCMLCSSWETFLAILYYCTGRITASYANVKLGVALRPCSLVFSWLWRFTSVKMKCCFFLLVDLLHSAAATNCLYFDHNFSLSIYNSTVLRFNYFGWLTLFFESFCGVLEYFFGFSTSGFLVTSDYL